MKNLEDEYKKSQQEPVPDLWNRIESGLNSSSDHKTQQNEIIEESFSKVTDIAKDTKTVITRKSSKIIRWSSSLGLCAAALLIVLIIPNVLRTGNKAASDSATPNENTTLQAYSIAGEAMDYGNAEGTEYDNVKDSNCDNAELSDYDELAESEKPEELSQNEIIIANMEITEIREENEQTIYVLKREDGTFIEAIAAVDVSKGLSSNVEGSTSIDISADLESVLATAVIGDEYLFTLKKADETQDFYEIEELEAFQK